MRSAHSRVSGWTPSSGLATPRMGAGKPGCVVAGVGAANPDDDDDDDDGSSKDSQAVDAEWDHVVDLPPRAC